MSTSAQATSILRSRPPQLILASGSPRRVELLEALGLQFEVIPSRIDESLWPVTKPHKLVVELAEAKAREVAERVGSGACELVVGADTIVVLDEEIIGKPASRQDASLMLERLSGRCHRVFTGVALVRQPEGIAQTAYEVSHVYMREIDAEEIEAYIDTGEPMDKAGAYALQGVASAFVEKIEGCFTNVIGLPVPLTVRLLRNAGVRILGLP